MRTFLHLRDDAAPRSLDLAALWAAFDRWLLIVDRDLLSVFLGAVLAHFLPGPPVWLFIVAPSGGTKTELLLSLRAFSTIFWVSVLTSRTFASGLVLPPGPDGTPAEDPSLLRQLTDHILVFKDFTTILEGRREERQAILAQLRELYDGQYDAHFGTGRTVTWKGRLSFIGGVTALIDRHQGAMAVCGERFVTFRPLLPKRRAVGRFALAKEGCEKKMRRELATAVHAFLVGRATQAKEQTIAVDEAATDHLVALADLVTAARSPVPRNPWSRALEHTPDPEAPTRFPKQLQAHAKGMASVHDSPSVTDRELMIITRVALDCVPPTRRRVLAVLAKRPKEKPTPLAAITRRLPGISPTAVRRLLEDLTALRVVKQTGQKKEARWYLAPRHWTLLNSSVALAAFRRPKEMADATSSNKTGKARASEGEDRHPDSQRSRFVRGGATSGSRRMRSTSLARYRQTEEGAADERAFFRDLARQEEPFLDDPGPVWDDEAPDADALPDDAPAVDGWRPARRAPARQVAPRRRR